MVADRDLPNTTHSGLPLRHGIHNEGPDRTQSLGASVGQVRARTGGPVATMHMSCSNGNLVAMGNVAALPTGNASVADADAGAEEESAGKVPKRQRSGDWPLAQVQAEVTLQTEAEWATTCFADQADLPSVLDTNNELGWQ